MVMRSIERGQGRAFAGREPRHMEGTVMLAWVGK